MEVRTNQRLEMHPDDAAMRDIKTGDRVRVWNERGELHLTALVPLEAEPVTVPRGVVAGRLDWAKLHPEGVNQNVLTSERLSDLGAGATFYSVLVHVERA